MAGFGKNLHHAIGQSVIPDNAQIIIANLGDRRLKVATNELPGANELTARDAAIDATDDRQIVRAIADGYICAVFACHEIPRFSPRSSDDRPNHAGSGC